MGFPAILWRKATPVIVGWFAGHTWKITVGGLLNCLIYCDIFIVYTQFTKVASGRIIQPGGPLFRLPWF